MDGILSYLQKQCNKNLQEIVNVSGWGGCHPKYLLDLNWNSCTHTGFNEPNQWIQYDMIDKRINLTHLTIKNNRSDLHLEHFKIFGSNDGVDENPNISPFFASIIASNVHSGLKSLSIFLTALSTNL